MNIFRSLFTSVPRTPMKHQTPPPPTVPAAIKSADEAKAQGLQDGGESLGKSPMSNVHSRSRYLCFWLLRRSWSDEHN